MASSWGPAACLEEGGLRDGGVGGVEVEGFVEGEGGDVPGVVLEQGLGEGLVYELVADGVGEDVDVVVDELAGVGEGVDVGGDAEMVLVGLVDDGLVDGGVHRGDLAVHVVEPELDEVGVVAG